MIVNSASFSGLLFGSYDSATNTFSPSNAYDSSTISGYISDSQSADGAIDVGDNVTYNYVFGGSSYSSVYVYQGFFSSNGTEYPLILNNGTYYLLGQTSLSMNYAITAQADTQVTVPCFASGTLIRTGRGGHTVNVAVEDLAVGDLAVTASGAQRPIRWLGHRTLDCRSHPRPQDALPVRIAAHALGANKPARDLMVSPGHAICVDVCGEVLIPASALVNGSTIRQVDVDSVTYWHVELDSHDIILAENLACESYLEMGNRGFFREAAIVAIDASPDAVDTSTRTHADFCRPFHGGGAIVEAVQAQLRTRADRLGWRLDDSDPFAGLHLVVDGVRVEPVTRGLAARFAVPAGARDVWLVSGTSRPCDIGMNGDMRELGVCLQALTIHNGFAPRGIDLDNVQLGIGLHARERTHRWTAGRAHLPAALWPDCAHDCYLRVDLAGPALPRWTAPSGVEPAQSPQASRPELVQLRA